MSESHFMSRYLNPPNKVLEIGRKLHGSFTIEGLMKQLQPGEVICGYFFNGEYHTAVKLDSQNLFDEFDGKSLEAEFFAVPQNSFTLLVSNPY